MTESAGWRVHQYDSIASTMDQAAALAQFGAPDRTLVVSAAQTAGRGRGARGWQAPAGSGLFCTAILRPDVAPARLSTLPLLAGVAVAGAIEQLTGCPARLKWPNDVWIGDDPRHQKVAGVLAVSRLRGDQIDWVLIGIGVNVSSRHADLPSGATSLLATAGVAPPLSLVLETMLEHVDVQYTAFVAANGHPSLASWRQRAALRGEEVVVIEDGRDRIGIFAGIDDDGALLLDETGHGIQRIVAGDLIRGPQSTAQFGISSGG